MSSRFAILLLLGILPTFAAAQDPDPAQPAPLIPLLRMPASHLFSPLGAPKSETKPSEGADEDRFRLAYGPIKLFDARPGSDPTADASSKVQTQYRVFERENLGVSLGMQAWMPAGLDSLSAPKGLTVFNPSLAWYRRIETDTVVRCSLSTNIRARPGLDDRLGRSLEWGLAAQRRVLDLDANAATSMHVFVEVLGSQQKSEDPAAVHPPVNWGLVPGLHLRCGQSWWFSGGVMLPILEPRDRNTWQLNASWRF